VWKRLGSEVTILEALPDFLGAADADVAKTAAREFKKQGLDIRLGAKVSKAEVKKDGVHLTCSDAKGEQTLVVDKLLVSVGRRAATKGLLAEGTGVKLDARGMVEVDEHCHTGVDGVWAVGDCVRGPMLAHKGFEEGIAVAELIAGLPGHVNLDTIPWVIYTEPESRGSARPKSSSPTKACRSRPAASPSRRSAVQSRWPSRRASSR
jgi:dihydrolipoamide dehydrogenase